jgi:hypothetical protein
MKDKFINMNLEDKVIDKSRRSQKVPIKNPKYFDKSYHAWDLHFI